MKAVAVGALLLSVSCSFDAVAQARFVDPGDLPCGVRKRLGLCNGPCSQTPSGGSSCPKGLVAEDLVIIGKVSPEKRATIIESLRSKN